MNAPTTTLFTGLACGALLSLPAQEVPSVALRDSASEYTSHLATDRSTFGAELLPRNQVARFFTPLEDQYYVIEIAVYPAEARITDLKRGDFRLRTNGKTVKAQNPHAVATFLATTAPPEPGMETTSHRSESIGIRKETGRPTEVFQAERAGVGISSGHYWTREDRETMYRELSSLELPEGATIQPVAGYLYFAKKNKATIETMDLIYQHGGKDMVLKLR